MRGGAVILIAVTLAASAVADVPRRRAVRSVPKAIVISDDFRQFQSNAWQAGFCDYSPVHADFVELVARLEPGRGFLLSSMNRSDDIFMFLKKRVTAGEGVRPNQRYEVSFVLRLASQVGDECGGAGGSPSESVYLKAGASDIEPQVVLVPNGLGGDYRLTVDKGNQAVGGPAASVAGNISNGTLNCSADAPFLTIVRTHRHPFIVQSNPSGEIWLLVGTDSGFEGKTTLYYEVISATLTPVSY